MQRREFIGSVAWAMLLAPAAKAAGGQPVIDRAWLGAPQHSHGHDALGLGSYPTSLHAEVAGPRGREEVRLQLPPGAVFEDGLARLVDLGGSAGPEVVVVSASREQGASLVVYGLDFGGGPPKLVERARSAALPAMRWLNPVGAADFDGDGRPEIVAVTTPHIGGVLTLYRHAPPHLVAAAREPGVSNHVYKQREQQLAAVLMRGGKPVVAVPDTSRQRLRYLTIGEGGGWTQAAPDVAFGAPIEQLSVLAGGTLRVKAGGEFVVLR